MAPLEWPGKVLSNSVRASGVQPGCYWLPESLSICLNAWMPCWLPAHLLDVSLCVKLCLLMDFCVCFLYSYVCVRSTESLDWQVWVLLQWAGSFNPFFFLLGCWIGKYSLLCSGQNRPLQTVIDTHYSMCYRCTGKLWLLRAYVLLERHEVGANICMSNHRAIWRLF